MSTTTTYRVAGMTCGHCVGSVTAELSKIDGVTNVAVTLESGEVAISSEAPLDDASVQAAVDEAGYELVT